MTPSLSNVKFKMNKFNAWETHFPNTESNEEYIGKTSCNSGYSIKSTSSHLYISRCAFFNVTGTTIRYQSSQDSSKLLVEYSSFNTCSSTNGGGAIYFGTYGQCVLSSVCGVKCNTGKNYIGQFCYIYVTWDANSKNHNIDSSVTLNDK